MKPFMPSTVNLLMFSKTDQWHESSITPVFWFIWLTQEELNIQFHYSVGVGYFSCWEDIKRLLTYATSICWWKQKNILLEMFY